MSVVSNDLEGGASFRWCSKPLQDLGKESLPSGKQFTVGVVSMRACHDHKRRSWRSRREHVLYKSSTGFKSHASNNADLCYPDKASFEKGDRKGRPWSTAIARCDVGRSATPLVRSIHQFDRI